MVIRWIVLGCLLLWVGVASAQLPTGLPSAPAAKPAPTPGFESARGALRNLIEAVEAEDLDRARRSLDLSGLNFALREREGNRRAEMTVAILNRVSGFRLDRISDDPTAEREAVTIVVSGIRGAVGRIELARRETGGWLMTSESVAALPEIWNTVRDRPPVNNLPTVFEGELDLAQRLRSKFGPRWWVEFWGLELWQWSGLGTLLLGGIAAPRASKWLVKRWPTVRRRLVVGAMWLGVAAAWLLLLPLFDLPLGLVAGLLLIAKCVAALAGIAVSTALTDMVITALSTKATGLGRRADSIFFPILRNFARFVVVAIVLVSFLASLDVNVTGIVAGLGIGGLVLALAAKDSVENVFGSVTILFDMPFGIGDWVKIGDVNGVVEEINLRSTRIRTFSDSVITLPNSNLTKAAVENFGARRRRRVDMPFAVGHANDLDAVKAFCDDVRGWMEANERFAPDSTYAYVTAVSDTAVTVTVQGYILTADYREELEVRQALVTAIKEFATAHSVALGPHSFPPLG